MRQCLQMNMNSLLDYNLKINKYLINKQQIKLSSFRAHTNAWVSVLRTIFICIRMKFVLGFKSFKYNTDIENSNRFSKCCSADNCLDLKSGGILVVKTQSSQNLDSESLELGLYSYCDLISSLSGANC